MFSCSGGRAIYLGTWHTHPEPVPKPSPIDRNRQLAPDATESFGVLIGTTSVDRRKIWIERATTPMAQDRRTRFSFSFRDPGHQRAVCGMFSCSGGRAIYLGTWHTHPEPVAETVADRPNDWVVCLRANRRRPLAFVLVGTAEVRVFVRARWRFRPLTEECDDDGID